MNDQHQDQLDDRPAAVEEVTVETLTDANAGSFCFGTVGSAGCPSSAGTVGTASSH